jgi:hypothetical protein
MHTNLSPASSGGAGEATNIAVQAFSETEFLTACKNGSGILELIGWLGKTGDKKLTRAGDSTKQKVGKVDEVALALMGRIAVTAVKDGSGDLLLISWSAPPLLASITRLHDSGTQAGAASLIAVTAVTESMLVTACAAGHGDLLLIPWQIGTDGTITRLAGSARAGSVSAVSITALATSSRTVLTAVKNGSGNLECIAWDVAMDGSSIVRRGQPGEAGSINEVAVVRARNDSEGPGGASFITAVVNGSNNLEVIAWNFQDNPPIITRRGSSNAGTASHISIAGAGPTSTYVASMRRGSGDQELIAYNIPSNGSVSRTGDFGDNQGGSENITETKIVSFGQAITAMRSRDFLIVNTWDVVNQPGA